MNLFKAKLIKDKPDTYSGTHEGHFDSGDFSIVRVNGGLTYIYLDQFSNKKQEEFSLWIENCPTIKSYKQLWEVFDYFKKTLQVVKALEIHEYQRGLDDGKRFIRQGIKSLLSV